MNKWESKEMVEPTMHKGIAYFGNYHSAKVIADRVQGRVVDYVRGFAVQYYNSGPYYPEPHAVAPKQNKAEVDSFPSIWEKPEWSDDEAFTGAQFD